MRLFTGISICPSVVHHLSRLLDHLRPTAHIKWTPVYNLHITTKFIGEFPKERLNEVKEALSGLPQNKPLEISINGLGWLPNPHNPRTLIAVVREAESLKSLAKATEEALETLGIALETRPFLAHLTLARIKEPNPLTDLKRTIAALPTVDFGTFTAATHHLFESCQGPAGTVYTRLADFPFTGQ